MAARLTGPLFRPEQYHYAECLDSTNTTAMTMARHGAADGSVVVANSQTRGRGRQQRVWLAPAGLNLSFSMILRPPLASRHMAQLTLLAGVALAESVQALGVTNLGLKWPNDLLLEGRKVAGILTEGVSRGEQVAWVVVGVGLNVNARPEDFPSAWAGQVTSLASHLGHDIPRGPLLASFLTYFEHGLHRLLQEGFGPLATAWTGYWTGQGERVRVIDGQGMVTGLARGLDEQGMLLLERDDGQLWRVVAGEVLAATGE